MKKPTCLFFLFILSLSPLLNADDGYRLWLKYDLIEDKYRRDQYITFAHQIHFNSVDPIVVSAAAELKKGLTGLLGKEINLAENSSDGNGIILQLLAAAKQDPALGKEGYRISISSQKLFITANAPNGLLYGAFGLLRSIQTLTDLSKIARTEVPKIQLRMLNHWDNVNGTIERGYAGASLWKWYELPENLDTRYFDYARANASIGINAVAINNVNASPRFLTREYLSKVKALAAVFRPYGIKVFLSINFASPKILGRLETSDPLDPKVQQWWQEKTKEVYEFIPDFGGFLVKANSEGEPGPQEHGRSHSDGANMLAEALKPFGGLVIWRAFVYSPDPNGDRFKEAYNEFKPLDGKFLDNVVVQVKNGPIDFQPREPFHPLFGAMPKTPLAMEFQITQEYLGFSTNLVYLATLFKECLDEDTYSNGKGSTVAKVIDGSLHNYPITVMAGVANTGSDRNWCGHLMSQANWFAFGRIAWDHHLTSADIAEEWIRMTLTQHETSISTIKGIMLPSREVYVNFTTPLGLHHIMGQNIHFGPEPWLERSRRPDWTSYYYHRADSIGLGFNRTSSGSQALSLYFPEVQNQWKDPATCDLRYLLWFHHIPWDQKLASGNTLWNTLCTYYYEGVKSVEKMQQQWNSVQSTIDPELFADVKGRLAAQHREALNWRDACVLYFQTYSRRPIPAPYEKPERTLDQLKELVRIYQMR